MDWKEVPAVVARIRDAQGRILLLKRRGDDRSFTGWCLPGGKVDADELSIEALEREVHEETGLKVVSAKHLGIERSPKPERQRIYMVHCYDVEIAEGPIVLSDEHETYRWVTSEEALELPLAGKVTRKLVLGDEPTHD